MYKFNKKKKTPADGDLVGELLETSDALKISLKIDEPTKKNQGKFLL